MAVLSQILLALSVTLSVVQAAPSAKVRTHYAPSKIPASWKQIGKSSNDKAVSMTWVLAARDRDGLTARMEQIALSRSAWLTEEEVKAYTAPTAETVAAAESAIAALGGKGISYNHYGDHVTFSTTVSKASKFFGASFVDYEHSSQPGLHVPRTHAYTLPSSIAAHVEDVYPIATFGEVKATPPNVKQVEESQAIEERATPSSCSTSAVSIACIRALYGFSGYTPTKANATTPSVAILGYIGQNFSPTDLKTYLTKYRSEAAAYTIPIVTSQGATNTASNPGVEAALDTQTVAGIIYPLSSTFYDIGTTSTPGDLFLITFQQFLGYSLASRPTVMTVSYGSDESDFTSAQATTMCNAAQQLAASGMTIIFSSGDSGVGGQGDTTCPAFQPTYPGGCPYVLSVGATQKFSPEVMVDNSLAGFYSGAGFSNVFPTASYQTSVVSAYIAGAGKTYKADYNNAGRAFPDVSAQGSLQNVVYRGSVGLVGGTSASAPIVAGGVALLNDLLVKAGKPTVGWAQPTWYSKASTMFTDVTSGGSYACASTSAGLPAAAGWDASAGLGTPVFSAWRTAYGV